VRKIAIASAAAALALSFVAGAYARDAGDWWGAVPSHHSLEKFDMSVGVTAGQEPRRAVRFEEDREVLHVPAHYGTLAGVTGDASGSVFWFRDAAGTLRNVVVRDTAARLVELDCAPTSRYEADARELGR
jgi:hypothetical protein